MNKKRSEEVSVKENNVKNDAKCKMYQTPSQSKRQAIFSLPYYIIFDFSE